MARLSIVNLHKGFSVNERRLKGLLGNVARRVGLKERALTFIFIGQRAIRRLNRTFTGRDCPTDVLSFPIDVGSLRGGDIFISLDAAKKNAAAFSSTVEREAVLYAVHGMLHLAGYNDGTARDRAGMRRAEEDLLGRICKTTDLSKVLTPR